MGLHHATLKSAIGHYLPLLQQGKSEEEIRTAIKADEKEFDQAGIDEIYAALVKENTPEEKSKEEKAKVYLVVNPFRDVLDQKTMHEPGADVSHFAPERLADLLDRNLIKLEE